MGHIEQNEWKVEETWPTFHIQYTFGASLMNGLVCLSIGLGELHGDVSLIWLVYHNLNCSWIAKELHVVSSNLLCVNYQFSLAFMRYSFCVEAEPQQQGHSVAPRPK